MLAEIYRSGHLAYVGGSFTTGVHNTMEPAVAACRCCSARCIRNAEEAGLLVDRGAGFVLREPAQALALADRLLGDDDERRRLGRTAREVVLEQRGATERSLAVLASVAGPAPGLIIPTGDAMRPSRPTASTRPTSARPTGRARWRLPYAARPRFIQLETVTKCNAECPFCPQHEIVRDPARMPDATWKKIVDDTRGWGITYRPFLTNEPFVDKRQPRSCATSRTTIRPRASSSTPTANW